MGPKRRIRTLFRPTPQAEVDDEIAFHIDRLTEDNVARGMDPEAARQAAEARFGDARGVRRECAGLLEQDRRAEARRDRLGDLRQDLRYGVRGALRSPLFSLLAVVTLALGIGANAAVFGVVKSVLLDALPYRDADRLARVYMRSTDGSLERSSVSAGAFTDLAARSHSFSRMSVFYPFTVDVTFAPRGEPRMLKGTLGGDGFLQTLGVRPALGRAFVPADFGSDLRVVMLSWAAWQREFGGDPRVLGTMVPMNGQPRKIVGVLPRGFVGPQGEADLWFPLDISPALNDAVGARKQHWLGVLGRLKPGVSAGDAGRELAAIAASLAREHPESDAGHTTDVVSLRDAMVGDTRTPLLVLMTSAGLVLLITCANLAGALLSRTIGRRKEFAVRMALGAGRGRLVRQMLTEAAVLSLAGGAAGLLLAVGGLALLRRLARTMLPPYADLSFDGGAVLVMAGVSVAAGLLFGVAPALAAGRSDPQGTLRDETRGSSESRRARRLRGALVAGQIALSLSLLAGAGLLARSLWAMTTAPIGYRPQGVVTVPVRLPGSQYPTPADVSRFYDRLTERVAALPGVTGVALASELPMPSMNRNGLAIEGVQWPAGDGQPFVPYASVSDDYFRTMGIPLKAGRTFTAQDGPNATPAVVISEGMARRFWPRGNALGAHVRLGPQTETSWGEVVGIVGDVRNDPARPTPEPMSYGTSRQDARGTRMLLVRAAGDPLTVVRPVQAQMRALEPAVPLQDARPLPAVLSETMANRRLPVVLMTAFGALALLLASVGVYAMFASMAAAREREFGVRVALGSTPRAIAALVLRQGAVWMGVGLVAGAAGVVVVSRFLRSLLYGVAPFDPVALGTAGLLLLACAAVALLVPVRRATHVDPITVLR